MAKKRRDSRYYISRRLPVDTSFSGNSGDPFDSSKKNPRTPPPGYGRPKDQKSYSVRVLPKTDKYSKTKHTLDLTYQLTTISKTQLYMQQQSGTFEGKLRLEKSFYDFIETIENGARAERRVIVLGYSNSYSGYIESWSQKGTKLTFTIDVSVVNPDLVGVDFEDESVQLITLPITSNLGFNLKKEDAVYKKLIQEQQSNTLRDKQRRTIGLGMLTSPSAKLGAKYTTVEPHATDKGTIYVETDKNNTMKYRTEQRDDFYANKSRHKKK